MILSLLADHALNGCDTVLEMFEIQKGKALNIMKKSHTCEEGGAHPRISAWHLLMNLKNNYLLKKLLKWTKKNVSILIFTKIKIKKNKEKHLEISLFYTYIPTEIDRIFCHFGPFFAILTP